MKNNFSKFILILIGITALSLMGGCGKPSDKTAVSEKQAVVPVKPVKEDPQAELYDLLRRAELAGESTIDLTEYGMEENEMLIFGYLHVVEMSPSTDIAARAEERIAEYRERLEMRRARERARAQSLAKAGW